jgi:hypothetical protein
MKWFSTDGVIQRMDRQPNLPDTSEQELLADLLATQTDDLVQRVSAAAFGMGAVGLTVNPFSL